MSGAAEWSAEMDHLGEPPKHRFEATIKVYADTHEELAERVRSVGQDWWHMTVDYGQRDEIDFSTDGTTSVRLAQPNPHQTPENYRRELAEWSDLQ